MLIKYSVFCHSKSAGNHTTESSRSISWSEGKHGLFSAPVCTRNSVILFPCTLTWSSILKVFFPCLYFFFYYFPSYLPCKNLNALSVTGVNTVQSFADMDVWWDSLQLCVFCFPVLCWHPKRPHIPLATTVFMHICNFTVWIWMACYCDGCILYRSNRPIFHFKFYSRTMIQWK